jgi:hypothetical protein
LRSTFSSPRPKKSLTLISSRFCSASFAHLRESHLQKSHHPHETIKGGATSQCQNCVPEKESSIKGNFSYENVSKRLKASSWPGYEEREE